MADLPDDEQGRGFLKGWGIAVILLLYIGLAAAYSVINPLNEATDELRHYRFVRIMATENRLPVQGEEPCRAQSHHPPLYYALAALSTAWIDTGTDICDTPDENPFWAYRYWDVGQDNKNQYLHRDNEAFPWYGDALASHIARGVNILIGAAVVLLTWAAGKIIWPKKDGLALGAAALVAFNPMFIYMSAAINNDIIAALAGAAITYGCIRLLNDAHGLSWRWGAGLGLIFSLSLLSKFNLAAAFLLIEGVLIWVAWRRNQWRDWLMANLSLAAVTLLVSGWWFVRNQMLYGEPTGFQQVTELWGVRNPFESFGLALSEVPYAFTTLWGRFGFGQIPLPKTIYLLLFSFILVGLAGALIGYLMRSKGAERWSLTFLFADVVLFMLVLFNYMLVSPAGPNGRFFFPALTSLSLIILYGIGQLIYLLAKWVKDRQNVGFDLDKLGSFASNFSGIGVSLGMLTLALVALFGYLAPAYAQPPSFSAEEEVPNQVRMNFDSLATLIGYDLKQDQLRPGEPVDVELYWQVNGQPPGDYLLFVHLLDEYGTIVAQRDTHPGLGNFPASQWRPGDRFVETIRLYLPETAYAPSTVRLSVGLYAQGAYRLGVTDENGNEQGDSAVLSEIKLDAADATYPNHQDQNFGDEIKLIGFQYDKRKVIQNQDLTVTLYWQAIKDIEEDYVVQVHLLSNDGHFISSDTSRPVAGESPTNSWQAGDRIVDVRTILIPPGTPTGTYVVDIALKDVQTNELQNIIADDGHWIDNHLPLAPVRIDYD